MLSHPQPHPLSLPPKRDVPLHPPQRESKRIIQMMELFPHPHPLFVLVPHPQPVAVKSLIYCLQIRFCFMVYHMCYACMCFYMGRKIFKRDWEIM